jgi:hypothetical protein
MWLPVKVSSHDGQMALLQHSSLYESMASWLSSAQKKFFGNTVVGRVLPRSALCLFPLQAGTHSANSFRSSASGAALGSAAGLAMVGADVMRGCDECRLQRKGSSLCEELSPLMDYKWGQ